MLLAQGMKLWLRHLVLGFRLQLCQALLIYFSSQCQPFPNDFSINGECFICVCSLYLPYVTLAAKYRTIAENMLAFSVESVMNRPLQSLIAGIFPYFLYSF